MKKYISSLTACLFFVTAVTAQIDRSKQPVPGPAPTINLGTPQTFNLDNGLKVMVVKNNKLPRVRVQLLIDNPMYATGDKAGVESLLAAMLGNGTTSISKDAFNEEIDFLGASINFGSQSAFASSLSKYFPRIFELLSDAAMNPLLTEEEFQKEKDKLLESLKNNKKDVSTISSRVSSALLYGKQHPKGEFVTEETVENITLADVRNYYQNFFSPKNAYLVVIGDVEFSEVERLSKEYFANWVKSTPPNIKYSDPTDVQYTQINFVDMPNAVQSEIVVENVVNLEMSHPDYHAALIANRILGGDFNSLLNMNLREEHGWTYGARSSTGAGKEVTSFRASTSVRNAVTDSAVVEMLKEINYIRNNKVTQEQLANAKAKYTGDFVLSLERPETVANNALTIETQNLSDDFYLTYLKKINAVTAEDVQRVARKYFLADNARIVVTGKGSEVLKGLQNIKREDGKAIPVRYFDIYGTEVEEPNYNMVIDASVTAEKVLDKYLQAIGGKDALKAVNSVFTIASTEVQGMQLVMENKTTNTNKTLVRVLMGGNALQKTVFDGTTGYTVAQGQRIEFTPEQADTYKQTAVPFMELTAQKVHLERKDMVDGNEVYVLAFGEDKKAFYDVVTGLKLKEETTIEQAGQKITSSIMYSDYKAVNNILFPHTTTMSFGPQEIKFQVSEIKINEGVTDEDFK